MEARIVIDVDAVADVCRRHGILRLALFGSVLTDAFGPESDVDVLVEFRAGSEPGFFALARIGDELCELFGRPVDVVTRSSVEGSANYLRRQRILGSARVVHDAA